MFFLSGAYTDQYATGGDPMMHAYPPGDLDELIFEEEDYRVSTR